METRHKIDNKLRYINKKDVCNLLYVADTNYYTLRGLDTDGRILFIKQFSNNEELFQFLCGMVHVLEVL